MRLTVCRGRLYIKNRDRHINPFHYSHHVVRVSTTIAGVMIFDRHIES